VTGTTDVTYDTITVVTSLLKHPVTFTRCYKLSPAWWCKLVESELNSCLCLLWPQLMCQLQAMCAVVWTTWLLSWHLGGRDTLLSLQT